MSVRDKDTKEAPKRETTIANAWRSAEGHTNGYYTWSDLVKMLAKYGEIRYSAGLASAADEKKL